MWNRQKIVRLIEASKQLSKNYSPYLPLSQQANKFGVLQYLNFKFIPKRKVQRNQIGIRNIYDDQSGLRISNSVMKLHNHPNIKVITYVLQGFMHAKIYSHQNKNMYSKHMKILKKGDFSFVEGDKKDNLHQFVTQQQSVSFVDILFPDYSQQNPCRFFQQQKVVGDAKVLLKEILNHKADFIQV